MRVRRHSFFSPPALFAFCFFAGEVQAVQGLAKTDAWIAGAFTADGSHLWPAKVVFALTKLCEHDMTERNKDDNSN